MIYAVKAFSDNYIWVIVKEGEAIVIDPGEASGIIDFLVKHQLSLSTILVTHHHDDHTGGVKVLQQMFNDVQVIAHHQHGVNAAKMVDEGDEFNVLGIDFRVWRTAGHTDTHISYLCDINDETHVFCGDTLFSGGCGRVFTGTMSQLFDSLQRFDLLPSDTLFYPAHEYTLGNLMFGQYIEPDNLDIKEAIEQVKHQLDEGASSLPTSLAREGKINVFLRCHQHDVIQRVAQLCANEEIKSPLMVFTALRELKNNF